MGQSRRKDAKMATKKKKTTSDESKRAIEESKKSGRRFPASAYERGKSAKKYPNPV